LTIQYIVSQYFKHLRSFLPSTVCFHAIRLWFRIRVRDPSAVLRTGLRCAAGSLGMRIGGGIFLRLCHKLLRLRFRLREGRDSSVFCLKQSERAIFFAPLTKKRLYISMLFLFCSFSYCGSSVRGLRGEGLLFQSFFSQISVTDTPRTRLTSFHRSSSTPSLVEACGMLYETGLVPVLPLGP